MSFRISRPEKKTRMNLLTRLPAIAIPDIERRRNSLRITGIVLCACAVVPGSTSAQYPSVPPPPPCHDPASPSGVGSRPIVDPHSLGIVLFQNTASAGTDSFLAKALEVRLADRLLAGGARVVASQRFGYEAVATPSGAATIGGSLGVAHIIAARVGRAKTGEISIDALVIRAKDGTAEWRTTATSAVRELPALVNELANDILATVARRKSGGQSVDSHLAGWSDPPSGEAVEHFLRGEYYSSLNTASGYRSALAQYDSAAMSDPAFAPGFANSAVTIAAMLEWGWWNYGAAGVRELTDRGMDAADRALRLDSTSTDAWLARGALLSFRNPRSYGGVFDAYTRAIAFSPRNVTAHHWYGRSLMQLGQLDAARRELAKALALAPGNASVLFDLAQLDRHEGRFSEACILLDSAIAANPTAGQAYVLRALTRGRRGELRFAWADAETGGRLGWPLWGKAAGAVIDARARDTSSARERARDVAGAAATRGADPQQWSGEFLPIALVASGQTDRALDLLERVRPRGARLWFALRSPEFASLRKYERYRKLLAASRPER